MFCITTTIKDTSTKQCMSISIHLQGDQAHPASRPAHAGWVLRTAGTGGRAGRVQTEVLVAMGSMSGDGSASANDDPIYADTAS